jgi:hypothetical protein
MKIIIEYDDLSEDIQDTFTKDELDPYELSIDDFVEKVVDRFALEDLLEEELGRDESEEYMDWVWEHAHVQRNGVIISHPIDIETPWDGEFSVEERNRFWEGKAEPPLNTPLRRACWWVEKNLPENFKIYYHW